MSKRYPCHGQRRIAVRPRRAVQANAGRSWHGRGATRLRPRRCGTARRRIRRGAAAAGAARLTDREERASRNACAARGRASSFPRAASSSPRPRSTAVRSWRGICRQAQRGVQGAAPANSSGPPPPCGAAPAGSAMSKSRSPLRRLTTSARGTGLSRGPPAFQGPCSDRVCRGSSSMPPAIPNRRSRSARRL